MGVLGLAPFLQKQFPEVFRELPQRLRSLSGKTLAIDGTLITQRLHFAPLPCENRHILGWYRLMRELKECGVGVICVFDGEQRSHAKLHETERRRKLQRMDLVRGAMEIERSRRLRRLTKLLKEYRALSEALKGRATQALHVFPPVSPDQLRIREPLRDSEMDSDVSPLANEPLESQFPLNIRLEGTNPIGQPPDGQPSSPAGFQWLPGDMQGQPEELLRFDEVAKNGNAELRPRPLKDILPEYFVAADVTPNRLQGVNKSWLATDGSPKVEPVITALNLSPTSLPRDMQSSETTAEVSNRRYPVQSLQLFVKPSEEIDRVSHSTIDSSLLPESLQNSQSSSTFEFQKSLESIAGSEPLSDEGPTPHGIPPSTQDDPFLGSPSPSPSAIPHDTSLFAKSADDVPSSATVESHGVLEYNEDFESVWQEDDSTTSSLQEFPLLTEIVDVEAEPSLEAISQGLLSLYQDYQDSISTFMSSPIFKPPTDMSTISEVVSAQDQYMMSRSQVQLTLDEGYLWASLSRRSSPAWENVIAVERLESLAQKSDLISRSYEKRNKPPTPKTYQECKLILRAMGVPCIEAAGPYEAEALAASLVHHGFADYVASEDTDVLVYEAPLLRNLTNRQNPLVLLSGAEVRDVLQLDRASYVDFALLLGTDFSQRIKYLGPHRAIKLIRTYRRIEDVIANEPKFIPHQSPDAYLKQVEVARLVFETLPPVPDPRSLQPTESDDNAVITILEKFGVYRAASVDWDFGSALDGNYFGDNPAMA